ncbi:glycosyltransferase [Acuticoccus sp.]|uniref:glycosyltransferase n=1 Tax=Acuticoccus sp. TaxID=1904378 RepID=UPI003B515F97
MPQIAGGSQSSTHELAQKLIERGHEVSVLAGIYHKDLVGYRTRLRLRLFGRGFVRDTLPGYPTYRRWFVWDDPADVLKAVRPNVVLVTSGYPFRTAKAFAAAGTPLAVYLRDVEFHKLGGDPRDLPDDTVYLANSEFTGAKYRDVFGIDPIAVPPFVLASKYAADTVDPRNVTFINPHPLKGRDIAFDVAERCPDIPFVFVEAWPLDAEQQRINAARQKAAPNVTIAPRTRDMRSVYAKARVLLVPSQWEEAWGRIASEAHCSGVPVVASAHGGLVESVGEGGVLIAPDAPIDDWVAAVRRLWDDDTYHAAMSKAARRYAERPELQEERQIGNVVDALTRAVERYSTAAGRPAVASA